jgi:HK97 family phage portal protein
MPGLFSRFRSRPPEAKVSRAAPLISLSQLGRPLWSERETRVLAEVGFRRNPIVHRAVRLVSETAASLPVTLFEGEQEVSHHPLLDLLARPNPRQAAETFLEALYVHLMVSGNAYLEQVSAGQGPAELYLLRPDRMKVVPGPDGWPQAYDYSVGSHSVRYRQDEGRVPPILHLTQFDPIDDYYGLPPLSAAQVALDTHNAASAWNKALLDNAARPSGALVYAADGANLTDEQFERLKQELEANFQGASNAGRPILLEGGLDWKPLSLSPKDMDFLAARNGAAREIALAFGVPPLLLGLPGDATLSNYAEANRAFWRLTVIPLVSRTMRALAHWLSPAYGAELRFEPDTDRVEALADERAALWKRVSDAGFLDDDEKRAAVGYGPRRQAKAAAPERLYNPNHDPANGRFTSGEGGADSSGPERDRNIQAFDPSGRGGGGGGSPSGSPRICPLIPGSSTNGIVCLYQCSFGIMRAPFAGPICPSSIFPYEGLGL